VHDQDNHRLAVYVSLSLSMRLKDSDSFHKGRKEDIGVQRDQNMQYPKLEVEDNRH
jgi:hypothetical protein